MKLRASTNDQVHELTIIETEGMVRVEIDGRQYNLDVRNPEEASYLVFNNQKVYDCRVEPLPKSRERFDVSVKGRRHSIRIIDPRRLGTDENSNRHHHGATEIAAQMPGKVVRVLVEVGGAG